jgi:hypothetical protein
MSGAGDSPHSADGWFARRQPDQASTMGRWLYYTEPVSPVLRWPDTPSFPTKRGPDDVSDD